MHLCVTNIFLSDRSFCTAAVMSGPEAATELRKLGCDSFIVGITGNVMPEDTATFREAGANRVLSKPFRMPALESLWSEYGVAASEANTAFRV